MNESNKQKCTTAMLNKKIRYEKKHKSLYKKKKKRKKPNEKCNTKSRVYRNQKTDEIAKLKWKQKETIEKKLEVIFYQKDHKALSPSKLYSSHINDRYIYRKIAVQFGEEDLITNELLKHG